MSGNNAMPDQTQNEWKIRDDQSTETERTYSLFTHLAGLLSVSSGGIPLLGLIATIILWRIKAKESHFIDDHGREAVNFQISLIFYIVVGAVLATIITIITFGIGAIIVAPLAVIGTIALLILQLIGSIYGAIAAHKGEYYRYPMTIRFISDND